MTAIPITALRFVLPLARALRADGFEVELATGPGRGLEELEGLGLPVHRLPITRNVFGWRNLHAIGAVRALLESGDFDVLHAHTPAAAAVGRLGARRRVRVLYTMHGSLWGEGVTPWRRVAFTALERALSRRTDLVFTVNPEDAGDCVRRARLPADRVVVLPAGGAGVGPEFGLDDDEVAGLRAEARRELTLDPDHRVVAYVGRTVTAKGMDVLAAAFRTLARQDRDLRLLIVGDALEGDRRAWTEARFREAVGAPYARRVLWLGFREDVHRFIAAADLVVLPSYREGFGMSLAEAAAMGRAVVAADTRGARAAVERDVTGRLVSPGDAAALADAIGDLLADPGHRARMGVAARRRARARFTRDAVLSAYLERYRALRAEVRDEGDDAGGGGPEQPTSGPPHSGSPSEPGGWYRGSSSEPTAGPGSSSEAGGPNHRSSTDPAAEGRAPE